MMRLATILLFTITSLSCVSSRQANADANIVSGSPCALLLKNIALEANDLQIATEARGIVNLFCPPSHAEITEERYGNFILRFSFKLSYPHRFNQMLDQLSQLPGLKIIEQH